MVRNNICTYWQVLQVAVPGTFTFQNKHDQSQLCHRHLQISGQLIAVHCDTVFPSLPLDDTNDDTAAVELQRIRRLLKLCMFFQLDYCIYSTDML